METQLKLLAEEGGERAARLSAIRVSYPEERTLAARLERLGAMRSELSPSLRLALAPLERALEEEKTVNLEALADLELAVYDKAERFRYLGEWTAVRSFDYLPEAEALGEWIVEHYRKDLRGFPIRYLAARELTPVAGRGRLGTATKLPERILFISDVSAIITLDFGQWKFLPARDRQRLVHHELEHLEAVDDNLRLRGHDFEDFASVVALYGLRSESARFSTDGPSSWGILAGAAQQGDLFGEGDGGTIEGERLEESA